MYKLVFSGEPKNELEKNETGSVKGWMEMQTKHNKNMATGCFYTKSTKKKFAGVAEARVFQ